MYRRYVLAGNQMISFNHSFDLLFICYSFAFFAVIVTWFVPWVDDRLVSIDDNRALRVVDYVAADTSKNSPADLTEASSSNHDHLGLLFDCHSTDDLAWLASFFRPDSSSLLKVTRKQC